MRSALDPEMAETRAAAAPMGYYGKLPARGDFVSQRLPPAFVSAWDEWLRAGLAASQAALGNGWLDAYLAAPLWRFVLPAGIAGGSAMIGVMMPSVDRAGRYFPLTLAAELAVEPSLASCFSCAPWLAAIEAVALRALEAADDFAGFEADAAQVAPPPAAPAPEAQPTDDGGLRVSLGGSGSDPVLRLAAHGAGAMHAGRSIFWTLGGQRVAAKALVSPALPPAERFSEFLCDAVPTERDTDLFGGAG